MRISACFLILALFLGAARAGAQPMYVGDLMKINMRSGRGTDYRIIALLKTGQKVQVLEKDNDWAKVEIPGGKQGWVLSRLLTSTKPCREVLSATEKELAKVRIRNAALEQEATGLRTQNSAAGHDSEELRLKLAEVEKQYSQLKDESQGLESLKQSLKEARIEAQAEKQAADEAREKLRELKKYYWFFLTGAGVFFIGYLLGSIGRGRRNSSLLR